MEREKDNSGRQTLAFYIDTMQKGGANRVVANLVNYFSAQNYNVVLINDVLLNDDTIEYPVAPNVKREVLDCNRKSRLLSNILRIKKLRSIIRKKKPIAIASFMGPPNVRLLISSIGLKCRKIVSVRNDPNVEYGRSKLKKLLFGLLFMLADGCVFQTEEAKNYFPESVGNKSRIILNPVNKAFYQINRKENTRDIITVGRLFEQKNHKLLISAYKAICEKYPNDRLIIYGEGPLRDELNRYIIELNLADKVFLPGQISNVTEALAKASVFVLSSQYEGLPNALMEAMAMGVPIISTDCPCGGPRSLITDGENGLLVKCDDSDGMAEAICTVLSQRELSEKLGRSAKERALCFSTETICKQWEDYIMPESK